ncbi:MAG TPA: hypothetical protein DD473_26675 [Planctomycetaceae bacterium]|nr:hypothetical protein [Planctomycetaceae bacterium]
MDVVGFPVERARGSNIPSDSKVDRWLRHRSRAEHLSRFPNRVAMRSRVLLSVFMRACPVVRNVNGDRNTDVTWNQGNCDGK